MSETLVYIIACMAALPVASILGSVIYIWIKDRELLRR